MKVKNSHKYKTYSIIVSIIVFTFSLILGEYYVNGDQKRYKFVYTKLTKLSLPEGYLFCYYNAGGLLEPIYFIIIWIGSKFIAKNLLMAIFNSLLAYHCIRLMLKWKFAFPITVMIVLTNYYFHVLYFAAERLKFGFLFLVLALNNVKSSRFFVYSTLALLSHLQGIIIYASFLFSRFIHEFKNFILFLKINTTTLLYLILFLIIPLFFYPILLKKYYLYSELSNTLSFTRVMKLIPFLFLALIYSQKKLETICLFLPLFCAAFLFGGERVNMLGYLVFLYYAVSKNYGWNLGIIVTSIYYAIKSIIFINNIIQYGDGFHMIPK